MRTTIDLDNDVLAAARDFSRQERISLGKAVSGLSAAGNNSRRNAGEFPTFTVPEGTRRFGTEEVKEAQDADVPY